MKLIKMKSGRRVELWEFFKKRLPPSLKANWLTRGYGDIYGITVSTKNAGLFQNKMIAEIKDDAVELRYPEWFSDFESIVNRYEQETNRTVTFRYWES